MARTSTHKQVGGERGREEKQAGTFAGSSRAREREEKQRGRRDREGAHERRDTERGRESE